jgi:hypothetical protein
MAYIVLCDGDMGKQGNLVLQSLGSEPGMAG